MTKIAFSADQLILQKQKLDFSITEPDMNLKPRFLIKGSYYIVLGSSTILVHVLCTYSYLPSFSVKKDERQKLGSKSLSLV